MGSMRGSSGGSHLRRPYLRPVPVSRYAEAPARPIRPFSTPTLDGSFESLKSSAVRSGLASKPTGVHGKPRFTGLACRFRRKNDREDIPLVRRCCLECSVINDGRSRARRYHRVDELDPTLVVSLDREYFARERLVGHILRLRACLERQSHAAEQLGRDRHTLRRSGWFRWGQ